MAYNTCLAIESSTDIAAYLALANPLPSASLVTGGIG